MDTCILVCCTLLHISQDEPDFDQNDLKMSQFVTSLVLVVLSCLSPGPGSVIIVSGQGQEIDIKVLDRGDNQRCASVGERERSRNEIHRTTILATTGHIHTCNGTPGWKRIAFINMTDASYNCPTGLNLTSYSKRTCGASHTTNGGCSSTTFSVGDLPYSRVCGRIRGYQFGVTSAFYNYTQGIDSYYVDGVSLTHGGAGSRQHIWTFAAGAPEVDTGLLPYKCPCDAHDYNSSLPAFVEDDFFCESGVNSAWSGQVILYSDDILWDGQDCTSNSTCCQFNNPPWFTKNLNSATTDDIELRICTYDLPRYADVPLEFIELYVQ